MNFPMRDFEALLKTIKNAKVITIWGHALPDGDCFGSQIGLREIIKENFPNKEVYAIGSGLPTFFERIAPMDEVKDETIRDSLAIIVDVSCLRRVEDQRVRLAREFMKFDHHDPNRAGESFPYSNYYVDNHKIACAEIIENFATQNRLKISKKAAESLYLGILTDSGCFRFYGTNKQTCEAVGRLMSLGVEPISIRQIAFFEDPKTEAFHRYLCKAVKRYKNVSYVYLKTEDYLSQGMTYEEAGSMVNCIETVGNPDIYCLFTEDGKGEIRGELRSDKGFPVQPTATHFHGGGHQFAAGTTTFSYEESMKVVEELSQVKRVLL